MHMSQQHTGASEVARLRKRIELEHEAACFALTSPALGTSKHWFITRRMNTIGACQEQLSALVGEQASIAMIVEVFESSPKQQGAPHE
jgi:hypothetical protein